MNKNEMADELDGLIQLITRTFHSSASTYLSGLDITMQQCAVLKLVDSRGDPRMTDLAEELAVTMGNMSSMVERLHRADRVNCRRQRTFGQSGR